MSVQFWGKTKDFIKVELWSWSAAEGLNERGIILGFELFDAEGITSLVRGVRQVFFRSENEFLFGFERVGAQRHHYGIEVAAARIEMTSIGKKIEEMHVINDYERVGFERLQYQVVERLFQRERMLCCGSLDEVLHIYEGAAGLLLQFAKDGGLAAASAAPHTKNRARLNTTL